MCSTDVKPILTPSRFGFGSDREQRLGAGLEQQVVDHRFVLESDRADARRQREHDVEVGHFQQLGLARLRPFAGLTGLALGAVPVTAAIVGNDRVAARLVLTAPATWPPRAAVRQPSIALITFNCAWLRWPRLARRQARPWSRKISATSRAGRDTSAAGYAGVPLPRLQGAEPIERAHHVAQHLARDVRIACRRVELGMAQSHLDQTDIDNLLAEDASRSCAGACAERPASECRRRQPCAKRRDRAGKS